MANQTSLNVNKSGGQARKWKGLETRIITCKKCPRLIAHCQEIAKIKRRAYFNENYWGKPVPGFGDPSAKIWIIGLAPGAHGANRTGRMFTGDKSGEWLYKALYENNFSNLPRSEHYQDSLYLNSVYISASARCAPPDNKPSKEELKNCFPYLLEELKLLKPTLKVILCLGSIGFETTLNLLKQIKIDIPKPKPKFAHGKWLRLKEVELLCSYHPSQQNTSTKKLTWEMWFEIFKELKNHSSRKS